MNKEQILKLLAELDLLDDDKFSKLTNISARTIQDWKSSRGAFPKWIESFLNLYENNLQLKKENEKLLKKIK